MRASSESEGHHQLLAFQVFDSQNGLKEDELPFKVQDAKLDFKDHTQELKGQRDVELRDELTIKAKRRISRTDKARRLK